MHYFDNPSDETICGRNQMQQNDQMPQIMAMLTKIFTKLEEHDLRFDALEQRMTALEHRVSALENRVVALATEVSRLGVLFEDNEKKLQHILDVLTSYL